MLKGKVAIVTGASRNLGRAISEMLGAEGAAVAMKETARPGGYGAHLEAGWYGWRQLN